MPAPPPPPRGSCLALALSAEIDVLVAADTALSFGTASVPDKEFPVGVAIQPFQLPAATGGNGAISYTAPGLSRLLGLKFDATGTDADGCPGTTPRALPSGG